MTVQPTGIEGLVLFTPRVFTDHRGSFSESFNQQAFEEATELNIAFLQDNESVSHKNVLRGLHFQLPPRAQGKLVHVISGSVLDIAVDLRKNSSTYGQHFRVELSGTNRLQLWIPAGFAHGFLSLEDNTVFAYKCTEYYSPDHEMTLCWNDPTLRIHWDTDQPVISEKDRDSADFLTFESPF